MFCKVFITFSLSLITPTMICFLLSRACRLKKKAQHEANKIKLYGLEHEHSEYSYSDPKSNVLHEHFYDHLIV